jgi:hypothetical protein
MLSQKKVWFQSASAVVAHSHRKGGNTGQKFFQRLAFVFSSLNSGIQVVHIGSVVLSMVDFHGSCINMRFECIVRIREIGKRECHIR